MLLAVGWAALFLLTVGSGESGIGAALWGGDAHHVVPAILGFAWGLILVAVGAPRTRMASVSLSIVFGCVFGFTTLILAELFSPLALVALVPLRAGEAALARAFRRIRATADAQADVLRSR
jgi:hypothetical protein